VPRVFVTDGYDVLLWRQVTKYEFDVIVQLEDKVYGDNVLCDVYTLRISISEKFDKICFSVPYTYGWSERVCFSHMLN